MKQFDWCRKDRKTVEEKEVDTHSVTFEGYKVLMYKLIKIDQWIIAIKDPSGIVVYKTFFNDRGRSVPAIQEWFVKNAPEVLVERNTMEIEGKVYFSDEVRERLAELGTVEGC